MLELAIRRFSQKNSYPLQERKGVITVKAGNVILRLGRFFEVITPSTKIVMRPTKAWADDRSLNVSGRGKRLRLFKSRDGQIRVILTEDDYDKR